MYSLEEIQNLIDKAIENLEIYREPKELYEPVHYVFKTGGKRLRPVLTLMSCNLFSNNVDEAVIPSLGLEIFHNFTLLHDDIMDEAALRRNHLTVHKKWDQNVAILSGDVMAILAYEYITSCREEILVDVIRVFNKTARQVCEGQQYDMNFERVLNVTAQEYLKMIEMKTSVLLAGCMHIGALIGGADSKNAELLYKFGHDVGMAYQLQDDLLDTYGNTEVFGKEIGGDIVANKKTFLLIKALEKADEKQQIEIHHLLKRLEDNPKKKIRVMKKIFDGLGIQELTKRLASHYYISALKNLNKVRVPEERKIQLKQLADTLLTREK